MMLASKQRADLLPECFLVFPHLNYLFHPAWKPTQQEAAEDRLFPKAKGTVLGMTGLSPRLTCRIHPFLGAVRGGQRASSWRMEVAAPLRKFQQRSLSHTSRNDFEGELNAMSSQGL